MTTPTLIRNFTAGAGGVRQYRIVKFGAADGEVVEATDVADDIVGVSCQPGTAAQGQRVDIVLDGIAEAIAGGVITRGAPVTTNGAGAAVAAAPAAGVNNNIVGRAMVTTASGDIFTVLLKQGRIQG